MTTASNSSERRLSEKDWSRNGKLKDGSAIKVTIARWMTPSGLDINHDGIKPDTEVDISEDDITNNKDPQLDKALESFNKQAMKRSLHIKIYGEGPGSFFQG